MIIIFLRTLIIFAAVLVTMRIMGKRQLGELEPSELVVAVLMADLAAQPLQDIGVPLLNGLIPVATLLACELLVSGLTMHSVRARILLCGKPSIVVSNGAIVQTEMRRNRYTLDELTEELRTQGIVDISKVKYAVLETDGRLNTILFPAEMPLTASQLGLNVEDSGYPSIVINDGKVLEENLVLSGHDIEWLERELLRRKIKSPREVYLMMVNPAGQVYYAVKEA